MDLLDKLNQNQKDAVLHTEGPLLILAGAGSGKTRVITHRIGNLIFGKGVRPYNIFAVTFTNKAADEMTTGVINLIGPEGNSVFIKTFHSASVYILRRYGGKIGIPRNYTIYDASDQAAVIKEILLKMKLDPKKIKPAAIASKISEVKDKAALIEGADINQHMPDHFSFDFSEVYEKYHEKLASQNALDFNDLLIKTVELLRSAPDVLRDLQRQWSYFMVDEYQDTNYAQYLIAKYLASETKNICVVGDDDQSIYSWRGADIRNILDFEKDYQDAKIVTLEENYRSTEPIIQAASALIRNNVNRKEKNVKAFKGDGEPVIHCQANNEYGEAEYVINTLISLKNREGFNNKDFSIFYRTNAQSRVFEDQLRKGNIPYKVIGGLKFYDRKEIKDILAYLKFAVNPLDTISLFRIINSPARGIGKATIDKIISAAEDSKKPEWEVIRDDLVTGRVPKGLETFKQIIEGALQAMKDIPVRVKLSKFVNGLINSSSYRTSLEEEKTLESNTRLENIEEFMNSIYDFEIQNPQATLDEFLQNVSLMTSEQNPEENPDDINNVVTLMTVHNAKGLEFPVVFLTGMEEDTFPHKLSIDTDEGIEEERRLCYVGITRAMDRIFISNAEMRRSFMGVDYREPSRFIYELPEHLMERKSYVSDGFNSGRSRGNSYSSFQKPAPSERRGFGQASSGSSSYRNPSSDSSTRSTYNSFGSSGSQAFRKPKADAEENAGKIQKEEAAKPAENGSKFRKRERVIHPKFGTGTITMIEGSGDNVKLTILFGTRLKTFLEKYTPLERA